jgi:hypothetical protein
MGPLSSRADRFVGKLYTRGKGLPPDQEASKKDAQDVLQRLAQRRMRVIRRNSGRGNV